MSVTAWFSIKTPCNKCGIDATTINDLTNRFNWLNDTLLCSVFFSKLKAGIEPSFLGVGDWHAKHCRKSGTHMRRYSAAPTSAVSTRVCVAAGTEL